MGSGLVSNIMKLALVPAIALSLNMNNIHAQDSLFEFDIDAIAEAGPQTYNHEVKAYDGWQNNFQPLCWDPAYGDNSLNYSPSGTCANFEAGLSLKIRLGDYFSIGPRLGINFPSTGLETINLNWWDPVKLEEIDIVKYPPIGISANLDLFNHYVLLNAEYSKEYYQIVEQDYQGVNVVNGKNYSVPLGNPKELYEGWGDKFSASIYVGNPEDNLYFGLGFFSETYGKDVSDYGIKLGVIKRISF